MATRNPNRTQVDIPFSSVPVVSPTITAGSGAVVGPAQVQPSKLLSLSNALGVATGTVSTLAGIQQLSKESAINVGKQAAQLAKNVEESAKAMEAAERKAVKENLITESQTVYWQHSYKKTLAERYAAEQYQTALMSRVNEATKNLEDGTNGEAYAKAMRDEVYSSVVENFGNDPLMLQAFNESIGGYDRAFFSQTITQRDAALRANKQSEDTAAKVAQFKGLDPFSESYDFEFNNILGKGEEGDPTNVTIIKNFEALQGTINSLMSGPPSNKRAMQIESLLDSLDTSYVNNTPVVTVAEITGKLSALRSKFRTYQNSLLIQDTTKADLIATEAQVFIGAALDNNPEIANLANLQRIAPNATQEDLDKLITDLQENHTQANSTFVGLIQQSDLGAETKKALLDFSTSIDSIASQHHARQVIGLSDLSDEEITAFTDEWKEQDKPSRSQVNMYFDSKLNDEAYSKVIGEWEKESLGFIGKSTSNTSEGRKTVSAINTIVGDARKNILSNSLSMIGEDVITKTELDTILNQTEYAGQLSFIQNKLRATVDEKLESLIKESGVRPDSETLASYRKEALDFAKREINDDVNQFTSRLISEQKYKEGTSLSVGYPITIQQELGRDLEPLKFKVGTTTVNGSQVHSDSYLSYLHKPIPDSLKNVEEFKTFDKLSENIKEDLKDQFVPDPTKKLDTENVDPKFDLIFSPEAANEVNGLWNYEYEQSSPRMALLQMKAAEEKGESVLGKLEKGFYVTKYPDAAFYRLKFPKVVQNSYDLEQMFVMQQRLLNAYEEVNKGKVDIVKDRMEALKSSYERDIEVYQSGKSRHASAKNAYNQAVKLLPEVNLYLESTPHTQDSKYYEDFNIKVPTIK